MAELLTLSLRETPATLLKNKPHLGRLYQQSRPFSHHQYRMTTGENRNEDRAVDRVLCLVAQLSFRHNAVVKRTQYHPHYSDSQANVTLHRNPSLGQRIFYPE